MQELKDILKTIDDFRKEVPVDVKGLASALGIKVEEVKLPPNISGKIRRRGNDFTISVNARDSLTRRRFTLAHELAHYVLHRHRIGDELTEDALYRAINGRKIGNAEESAANTFAANLLMPADSIISLQNDGIENTDALAKKFEVSPRSMEIRLGRDESS